jgi:sugar lactone lactonase YvrE
MKYGTFGGGLWIGGLMAGLLSTTAAAQEVVVADVGFVGPEAVRYDEQTDRYLVSNLGLRGEGSGNDGFISILSPEGQIVDLRWIAGGVGTVELFDPLGIFLKGDTLYVADTRTIRLFDRASGTPKGALEIPDAVRLNDLTVDEAGVIYVTDSGSATQEGALYRIDADGRVDAFAERGPDLAKPNGIAITRDGLVVHGGLGSAALVFRTPDGAVVREMILPTGRIDGIVALDDGGLLVASQDGGAVYHVAPNGVIQGVASGIAVPAAVGFDTRRSRLLVPQISAATISFFNIAE